MKKWRILVIAILATLHLSAQDMHFSQYNDIPIYTNPASTGDFIGGMHRLNLIYRDQWGNIAPYKTFAGSVDMAIFDGKWRNDYMGIGLVFLNDRAGDGNLTTNQGGINLNYLKGMDPWNTIALGVHAGFGQRSLDYTKLRWDSQYDGTGYNPDLPSREREYFDSFIYADIGWGMLWILDPEMPYSSRLGYAMSHINQPNIGQNDMQLIKHTIHWDSDFRRHNSNFHLHPTFLYQRQGKQQEFVYGVLFGFDLKEAAQITGWIRENYFAFGFKHRWDDALLFLIKLNLKGMEIGLCYDTNVSGFRNATQGHGGFEVSLKYTSQLIPKWRKGASRY